MTDGDSRNDNISAFLSHLLEVIWESRLVDLFSARYDPCTEILASVHDSFALCRPLGALHMHALLTKHFVGEFRAYTTWKLMRTNHEHSTKKPQWAFYERFSPIYNWVSNHHTATMFPPHMAQCSNAQPWVGGIIRNMSRLLTKGYKCH